MPNHTVSGNVDTMMRAADNAAIRSAIGVGTTDAPTFLSVTTTDSAPTPTLANFKGSGGTAGIGFNSGNMWYGGSIYFIATQSKIRLASTHSLGWSTDIFNADADTILVRDGVGAAGAGILAQRNGDAAQAFRLYNFYNTAGANYERGEFVWSGNTLFIQAIGAGTGVAQPLSFGGASINFRTSIGAGYVARWNFSTTGHFLAATDNTYDIGASGANRPRNIYVAGSINVASAIIGAGQTGINSSGVITMLNRFNLYPPSDGVLTMSNNAGTGFTRLELGSTNLGISRGTGSPEGVVTALVGSLYIRTDGGASTTLYVKESSPTPSTGWVAK